MSAASSSFSFGPLSTASQSNIDQKRIFEAHMAIIHGKTKLDSKRLAELKAGLAEIEANLAKHDAQLNLLAADQTKLEKILDDKRIVFETTADQYDDDADHPEVAQKSKEYEGAAYNLRQYMNEHQKVCEHLVVFIQKLEKERKSLRAQIAALSNSSFSGSNAQYKSHSQSGSHSQSHSHERSGLQSPSQGNSNNFRVAQYSQFMQQQQGQSQSAQQQQSQSFQPQIKLQPQQLQQHQQYPQHFQQQQLQQQPQLQTFHAPQDQQGNAYRTLPAFQAFQDQLPSSTAVQRQQFRQVQQQYQQPQQQQQQAQTRVSSAPSIGLRQWNLSASHATNNGNNDMQVEQTRQKMEGLSLTN